jgi:hypothetical protein
MRMLIARRPTPALVVALVALFMALGGASYAAVITTPTLPSFTAHGVALVRTIAGAGTPLPISGAKSSAVFNHGMTVPTSTAVAVPTTGIYNLTLAGNCNGGATNSYLEIREGNGLQGNKVDLFLGFEGNPSLAGANTVHLPAGTRLNMIAGHGGIDANCGVTMGATLVSAD